MAQTDLQTAFVLVCVHFHDILPLTSESVFQRFWASCWKPSGLRVGLWDEVLLQRMFPSKSLIVAHVGSNFLLSLGL